MEITDEERDLYRRTVNVWGIKAQMNMLMEECGELIVACCHLERGRVGPKRMAEEIADVQNMINQVICILDDEMDGENQMSRLVDLQMLVKMERTERRLELEKD